ncbi:TRAP transporter permease [Metallumcola ferriviriculae]|uniref:TRAP transporter permease n=1 Tax=Metallumcola ferriviriculae TaxID=3039180 RepID=A0AAU0UNU5_9FIRM|nr:TRAP transporter permease [Desulfitibacteraceae bacterium MK1]
MSKQEIAKEKNTKKFSILMITAVALALTAFQLYTAGVSLLGAWIQRDIHLVFILVLTFLIFPLSKRGKSDQATILDGILVTLAIASGLYIIVFYQEIVMRAGSYTTLDTIFGIIMILLLLEATRRAVGWVLVFIAGFFLIYTFIGPYLPGLLGHKGYGLERVVSQMYLTTEGIFGIPLGVSANYIFLFIFLTSMLEKLGMGEFLLRLAMSLMGRFVGGPAKVAVLASGFMGSLTGSAVANVVGTGTFTIPLMKSNGYKSHFAGAVESCASSGGQLMPPVMGAAAFIIAEFLGIPYIEVAVAAIIPAVLFYISILFGVHFEACRLGLKGLPKKELPSTREVLKEGWYLLLPLVALLYFLGVVQYSPIRSGFYAIVTMFIVSFVSKDTRLTWQRFVDGALAASRNTIMVALACATAGLVVGSINLTGVGLKLSSFIISLSGGYLWIALLLTGMIAIVLGMGLPTSAAYIVAGTMAAPALIEMGILPLGSHLFVFYFAIISAITPPVALAAYAASGIAQDDPMKIAFTACKIGVAAYIIPFLFAQSPALLGQGSFVSVSLALITAIIGVAALAGGSIGYFVNKAVFYERVLLIVGAFSMLYVGIYTDLLGIIAIGLALFTNIRRGQKQVVNIGKSVEEM